MTLNCDIVIASEEAHFSFPFTKRGFSPGFGNTYNLPRLLGIHKACELTFTGRAVDAAEAEKIGLVNMVVPAGELMNVAYEMARHIAEAPLEALQLSKRLLYHGLDYDYSAQIQSEVFSMNFLHMTAEFDKATKAFLDKEEGTRAYQL
jgi:2-(1,2-epoxy-1,2-dihydrophenyl)acetyl-CoA isomerase